MKATEQVAVATALQKGISEACGNARAAVASDMSPGDRKVLYIGDTKVGTASLTEAKPKTSISIHNVPEFLQWCLDTQVMPTVAIPAVWYGRNGFCQVINGELINVRTGEAIPGVKCWQEEAEPVLQIRRYMPEHIHDESEWAPWVIGLCSPEMLMDAVTLPMMLEEGAEDGR